MGGLAGIGAGLDGRGVGCDCSDAIGQGVESHSGSAVGSGGDGGACGRGSAGFDFCRVGFAWDAKGLLNCVDGGSSTLSVDSPTARTPAQAQAASQVAAANLSQLFVMLSVPVRRGVAPRAHRHHRYQRIGP
jgi:hypothetical protein